MDFQNYSQQAKVVSGQSPPTPGKPSFRPHSHEFSACTRRVFEGVEITNIVNSIKRVTSWSTSGKLLLVTGASKRIWDAFMAHSPLGFSIIGLAPVACPGDFKRSPVACKTLPNVYPYTLGEALTILSTANNIFGSFTLADIIGIYHFDTIYYLSASELGFAQQVIDQNQVFYPGFACFHAGIAMRDMAIPGFAAVYPSASSPELIQIEHLGKFYTFLAGNTSPYIHDNILDRLTIAGLDLCWAGGNGTLVRFDLGMAKTPSQNAFNAVSTSVPRMVVLFFEPASDGVNVHKFALLAPDTWGQLQHVIRRGITANSDIVSSVESIIYNRVGVQDPTRFHTFQGFSTSEKGLIWFGVDAHYVTSQVSKNLLARRLDVETSSDRFFGRCYAWLLQNPTYAAIYSVVRRVNPWPLMVGALSIKYPIVAPLAFVGSNVLSVVSTAASLWTGDVRYLALTAVTDAAFHDVIPVSHGFNACLIGVASMMGLQYKAFSFKGFIKRATVGVAKKFFWRVVDASLQLFRSNFRFEFCGIPSWEPMAVAASLDIDVDAVLTKRRAIAYFFVCWLGPIHEEVFRRYIGPKFNTFIIYLETVYNYLKVAHSWPLDGDGIPFHIGTIIGLFASRQLHHVLNWFNQRSLIGAIALHSAFNHAVWDMSKTLVLKPLSLLSAMHDDGAAAEVYLAAVPARLLSFIDRLLGHGANVDGFDLDPKIVFTDLGPNSPTFVSVAIRAIKRVVDPKNLVTIKLSLLTVLTKRAALAVALIGAAIVVTYPNKRSVISQRTYQFFVKTGAVVTDIVACGKFRPTVRDVVFKRVERDGYKFEKSLDPEVTLEEVIEGSLNKNGLTCMQILPVNLNFVNYIVSTNTVLEDIIQQRTLNPLLNFADPNFGNIVAPVLGEIVDLIHQVWTKSVVDREILTNGTFDQDLANCFVVDNGRLYFQVPDVQNQTLLDAIREWCNDKEPAHKRKKWLKALEDFLDKPDFTGVTARVNAFVKDEYHVCKVGDTPKAGRIISYPQEQSVVVASSVIYTFYKPMKVASKFTCFMDSSGYDAFQIGQMFLSEQNNAQDRYESAVLNGLPAPVCILLGYIYMAAGDDSLDSSALMTKEHDIFYQRKMGQKNVIAAKIGRLLEGPSTLSDPNFSNLDASFCSCYLMPCVAPVFGETVTFSPKPFKIMGQLCVSKTIATLERKADLEAQVVKAFVWANVFYTKIESIKALLDNNQHNPLMVLILKRFLGLYTRLHDQVKTAHGYSGRHSEFRVDMAEFKLLGKEGLSQSDAFDAWVFRKYGVSMSFLGAIIGDFFDHYDQCTEYDAVSRTVLSRQYDGPVIDYILWENGRVPRPVQTPPMLSFDINIALASALRRRGDIYQAIDDCYTDPEVRDRFKFAMESYSGAQVTEGRWGSGQSKLHWLHKSLAHSMIDSALDVIVVYVGCNPGITIKDALVDRLDGANHLIGVILVDIVAQNDLHPNVQAILRDQNISSNYFQIAPLQPTFFQVDDYQKIDVEMRGRKYFDSNNGSVAYVRDCGFAPILNRIHQYRQGQQGPVDVLFVSDVFDPNLSMGQQECLLNATLPLLCSVIAKHKVNGAPVVNSLFACTKSFIDFKVGLHKTINTARLIDDSIDFTLTTASVCPHSSWDSNEVYITSMYQSTDPVITWYWDVDHTLTKAIRAIRNALSLMTPDVFNAVWARGSNNPIGRFSRYLREDDGTAWDNSYTETTMVSMRGIWERGIQPTSVMVTKCMAAFFRLTGSNVTMTHRGTDLRCIISFMMASGIQITSCGNGVANNSERFLYNLLCLTSRDDGSIDVQEAMRVLALVRAELA